MASGDLVLVSVSFDNGLTVTVTDDQSTTWTSGIHVTDASRDYQVFWAIAGAGGMKTITLAGFGTVTPHTFQMAVSVWYNTASSSPVDVTHSTLAQTPANNTAPNITDTITTTVDGDLIYNIIFDESLNVQTNAVSSITWGTGKTGLYVDILSLGAAAEYQVQATHGALTSGMTFVQTTHDTFAMLTVAIKPGSSGSTPGTGIGIIRSQVVTFGGVSGALAAPFPTSGNLIIVAMDVDDVLSSGGVTDSNSNTYNKIAGVSTNPNLAHADNATTSNNLVITFHLNANGNTHLPVFYDVTGAATSPLDTAATAANSSTLTAGSSGATTHVLTQGPGGGNCQGTAGTTVTCTDLPSVNPSTSNGLIINPGVIGTGPAHSLLTTNASDDYCDATFQAGGGDGNTLGNGDYMGHYFNPSTSTVSFDWQAVQNASQIGGLAVVFKAAPVAAAAGGMNKRQKLEQIDPL